MKCQYQRLMGKARLKLGNKRPLRCFEFFCRLQSFGNFYQPICLAWIKLPIYPWQVKKGSQKNSKQEPDTSEYSTDEMLKMMLDNNGVDPLTQTLSDNKTKTKPGVNISHFAF